MMVASLWPKPCPVCNYLAFFLGGFSAGVFIIWENNLWKSIPFWSIVIKSSAFQTLTVFLGISAYRFWLMEEQKVGEEPPMV